MFAIAEASRSPDDTRSFSRATDVIAVGDVTETGNGALYENNGSGWQAATLAEPLAWHGVGAGANQVFVVGDYGVVARRDESGTWSIMKQSLVQLSFHAAWVDSDGGLWGVGGEFASAPTQDGFLVYFGTEVVPPITL